MRASGSQKLRKGIAELGAVTPNKFRHAVLVFDPPWPTLVKQLSAQLHFKQASEKG